MARIADTERVLRLLRESEGGSLARREIVESLGLSDDRYKEVATQLGDRVEINRGRLGGLRLSGHPRGGAGANEARAPADVPEPLSRAGFRLALRACTPLTFGKPRMSAACFRVSMATPCPRTGRSA
jgi:hypothetical protein